MAAAGQTAGDIIKIHIQLHIVHTCSNWKETRSSWHFWPAETVDHWLKIWTGCQNWGDIKKTQELAAAYCQTQLTVLKLMHSNRDIHWHHSCDERFKSSQWLPHFHSFWLTVSVFSVYNGVQLTPTVVYWCHTSDVFACLQHCSIQCVRKNETEMGFFCNISY